MLLLIEVLDDQNLTLRGRSGINNVFAPSEEPLKPNALQNYAHTVKIVTKNVYFDTLSFKSHVWPVEVNLFFDPTQRSHFTFDGYGVKVNFVSHYLDCMCVTL
jgi:hypothetical protein